MAIQKIDLGGGSGAGSTYKYSKEWHVDPVNGLDTNDGSYGKPFKTLAYLVTKIGNTGEIVYLHAGTYSEQLTHSALNVTYMGVGIGGVVNINGDAVINSASSSTRFIGIRIKNVFHTGAGSLYMDSCQVTTGYEKSLSGYAEFNDCDMQTAAIKFDATATGYATFIQCRAGTSTYDAILHATTFKDCAYVGKPVHTQGNLFLLNSQVFAVAANDPTLTSAGVLVARNTNFFDVTGASAGKIVLTGMHSLSDVVYDEANSSISNVMAGDTSIFNNLKARHKLSAGALNLHYDGSQTYDKFSIVEKDNTLWIANDDIAFVGFSEGTTGATWRKVGAAIDPTVQLNTEPFTAGGPITTFDAVRLQADGTVLGKYKAASILNNASTQLKAGTQYVVEGINIQNISNSPALRISYYDKTNQTNLYYRDDTSGAFDGTVVYTTEQNLVGGGAGATKHTYIPQYAGSFGQRYWHFYIDPSLGLMLSAYNPFSSVNFTVYLNDIVTYKVAPNTGGAYGAVVTQGAAGKLILHPFAVDSNGYVTAQTQRQLFASGGEVHDVTVFGIGSSLANWYAFVTYTRNTQTNICRVNLSTGTIDQTIVLGNYKQAKSIQAFNNHGIGTYPSTSIALFLYDNISLDYKVYRFDNTMKLVEMFADNYTIQAGIYFDVAYTSGTGASFSVAINTGTQVNVFSGELIPDTTTWTSIRVSAPTLVGTATNTNPVKVFCFGANIWVAYTSGTGFDVKTFTFTQGALVSTGDYIGIAQENATTNGIVQVAVDGQFSRKHTGLTIGSNYYALNGDLVTDPTGATLIGKAISDTTIHVNFSSGVGAQVIFQANTTTLPAGTEGSMLIITSDGTSAGSVKEQWLHDGTDWIQISGGVSVSSNVLDNTIVDPDFINITGRYIVPATGAVKEFVGHDNEYADYDLDTDTFVFSTPTENDIVLITSGTNTGQLYKYKSTTKWSLFTKTTGLPVYTWALANSYKANDLVVYNNSLYQANNIIAANTPFTVGINGATWKQISASAALAEYGETPLTTTINFTVANTNYDIMSFTIPSAGTWEIKYHVRSKITATTTYCTYFVATAAGVEVPYSRAIGQYFAGSAVSDFQMTATMSMFVTTTGPTIYKLVGFSSGTGSMVIADGATSGAGGSKVTYNKIAGYVPATGQVSDYIMVSRTGTTQSVSTGSTVLFNTINSTTNGIAYNTTSGVFSLKANVTYEMDSTLYIAGTVNGEIAYSWCDATSGAQLVNGGGGGTRVATYSGGNNESTGATKIIYTPSTNQNVILKVVACTVANTTIAIGYTYATIKQIGTTSVSQFVGMLSNEWSSVNSYAAGTIVARNNVLYQANGAIGSGAAWVEGTTGATWRALYARTDLLAETGTNIAIVHDSTITSAGNPDSPWSDVSGGGFTIPSAGTWEVEYNLATLNSSGNWQQTRIVDSTGGVIPSSLCSITPGASSPSNNTAQFTITTTASQNFKLQARTFNGSTITVKNYRGGATGVPAMHGDSYINWRKISGFIPATGSTVSYGRYYTNINTTVNSLYTLTKQDGSMDVESNNYITLKAGVTYALRAQLSVRATYAEWAWFTEAGVQIGTGGWSGSVGGANATDPGAPAPAYATYTPSADTRVCLKLTGFSNHTQTDTLKGEVSIMQVGTTNVSQFLGVLSNDWNIANSYPPGAIVVRNGTMWQSNALIPSGTAFVEGTSGLTWRPMYAKTDLLAEYGEINAAAATILTGTTQATANTVLTITVPSAGTWELEYILGEVTLNGGNIDDTCYFFIRDLPGNTIAGSNSSLYISSASNGAFAVSQKVTVTTNGPTTYNLKGFYTTGYVTVTANTGNKMRYRKLNGYIPATGSSLDSTYVKMTAAQTLVTTNSDLILDTLVSYNGNITYNNTTGVFSLKAGVTYELTASLYFKTFSNGAAGYIVASWVDATTNTAIPNMPNGVYLATGNNSADSFNPTFNALYTPTVDKTIKLRCTGASGTATFDPLGTSVIIKQLGTTNVSQFMGTMSNDWAITNSYPSGSIVVYSNALYQANAAIAPNTPFVTGTSGQTWKKLTSSMNAYDIQPGSRTALGGGFLLINKRLFVYKGNQTDGWGFTPNGISYAKTSMRSGFDYLYEIEFLDETPGTIKQSGVIVTTGYALFENGNLYTWGSNNQGALGLGDNTDRQYPTLAATGVNKVYDNVNMDATWGEYVALVIQKNDGFVYAAGNNNNGMFGLGNTTALNTFTKLTWMGANPISVWPSAGYGGILIAQLADGTLWGAGFNAYGQLGNGNNTSQSSPVNLTANWFGGDTSYRIERLTYTAYGRGTDNSGAAYGNLHILAKNAAGYILKAAGYNGNGELADGTFTNRNTPVSPAAPLTSAVINNFKEFYTVGGFVASFYFLTQGGDLYVWGYNGYNNLGDGLSTSRSTPVLVQTNVVSMHNETSGKYSSSHVSASPIIKKADGYHYCAGYNGYFHRGDGNDTASTSWTKMLFKKDITIKAVVHSQTDQYGGDRIVITSNNELYIWGYNNAGLVDINTAGYRAPRPIKVIPRALDTLL